VPIGIEIATGNCQSARQTHDLVSWPSSIIMSQKVHSVYLSKLEENSPSIALNH
jgi:hypothetical protein